MIRQIQYFQAVVRCNSFTEAAEECHISQSAISQQIQALERELGVKLLERRNRKFSLTPAGEYFYKNILRQGSERTSGSGALKALLQVPAPTPESAARWRIGKYDILRRPL